MVQWVAGRDMATDEGALASGRVLSEAARGWYASPIDQYQYSHVGVHRTPEPILEFLAEILDPTPGARVHDPCFGSGQLLAMIANGRARVSGVEVNESAYVIGATQVVLAGASDPVLVRGDAFLLSPADLGAPDGFDRVIAHPPFGRGPGAKTDAMEMRFLQHVMTSLAPGGRAVILLPEISLYSMKPAFRALRGDLLANFAVEGVIALPSLKKGSVSSRVNMNALVFRHGVPRSSVRFMRVPTNLTQSPRLAAVNFQKGGTSDSSDYLWRTPVREIEGRGWDLLPKRSGQRALVRELDRLCDANPKIAVQPLGGVAEIRLGLQSNPRRFRDRALKGDIGVVRSAEITMSGIRRPSKFMDAHFCRVPPNGRLQAGDVVLTTLGRVGRVAVVGDSHEGAIAGDGVAVIRPGEKLLPRFLKYLLVSDLYQDWLAGHARGSFRRLYIAKLRKLPVPVSPKWLQIRVTKRVSGDHGHPLAAIIRILAKMHDPVAEWLEESAEARQLLGRQSIADGPALLASTGASLLELNERAERCGGAVAPELSRWLDAISVPITALVGLTEVPPGAARLAVLGGMSVVLERLVPDPMVELTTISHEPLLGSELARQVTRRIRDLADTEQKRILENVKLEADLKPNSVSADPGDQVWLRLTNRSLLPLRGFEAFTLPQLGGARNAYLAVGATLDVPLRMPSDAPIGTYRFTVRWRAVLLNGRKTEGRIPLAVDIRAGRPGNQVREIGTSPYIVGSPIDRKEMLFGRDAAIKEICRQLRIDSQANVVLLEGNRRTGKTSILKRLQDPEVLPEWITVNCSLQGGEGHASKVGLPTNEVFRLMARDLGWAAHAAGIRVRLPDAGAPEPSKPFKLAFVKALRRAFSGDRPFETFELFLQTVIDAARPRRVLLMLDEFDKLQEGIDAGVTSPQVPENIRYLLHTYPELSAILAGSRRIKRLREEYWNALFGFGHRVPVSGLQVEDARLLVTQPVDGRLVYVPEARNLVVELCARQPFLIQSLCNRIFESAASSRRRTVTVDDVNAAAAAMTEDNEHFRTLWGYAGTERRRFLLALCQNRGDHEPATLDLLEMGLTRHGVHLHRGERLGDDLELLRELEMLELRGTRGGSAYLLAVPLMAVWIERNVDFENQRRMAVEEFEEADRGDGYWDAAEEDE